MPEAASSRSVPVLRTSRVVLRLASRADVAGIVDYYERNRAFFSSTDPLKPEGFYTVEFWVKQIDRSLEEFYRDQAVKFFVFEPSGRVIGSVSFTCIVRGAFHACYLGYALDEVMQGQGLMAEALQAAIPFAFDQFGLHRIMANYMPQNARSAAVLRRQGFIIEGEAREYLRIGGEWRDHVLTSLTNGRWRDPALSL